MTVCWAVAAAQKPPYCRVVLLRDLVLQDGALPSPASPAREQAPVRLNLAPVRHSGSFEQWMGVPSVWLGYTPTRGQATIRKPSG